MSATKLTNGDDAKGANMSEEADRFRKLLASRNEIEQQIKRLQRVLKDLDDAVRQQCTHQHVTSTTYTHPLAVVPAPWETTRRDVCKDCGAARYDDKEWKHDE